MDKSIVELRMLELYVSRMAKIQEHAVKVLVRLFAEVDTLPLLADIEVPTLVLTGVKPHRRA